MKKCISFMMAFASIFMMQPSAFAQHNDENRIEGSGHVVTKDVSIQSFDNLDLSGVYNVKLMHGSKEQLKIEADDNLQDLFLVSNEGSTLKIKMKDHSNFNSKTKMTVYITFSKLKGIKLKTVGGLTSEENLSFDDLDIKSTGVGSVDLKLTAQTLNLNNSGVGHITLSGKADNATFKNTGVGSIHAGDFVVQKMDIENTGVGHSEVNAEKELRIKDSFLGKVKNKGNAAVKRVNKVSV